MAENRRNNHAMNEEVMIKEEEPEEQAEKMDE
jgi:hypothetical protein